MNYLTFSKALPGYFMVVQVNLRRLGYLLRARPVAHLMVQELPRCLKFFLDLKRKKSEPTLISRVIFSLIRTNRFTHTPSVTQVITLNEASNV